MFHLLKFIDSSCRISLTCDRCRYTFLPECNKCYINFNTIESVEEHLNTCKRFKETFSCDKCLKSFSVGRLDYKTIKDNSKFKCFYCEKCSKTFESHSDFLKHHRIIHELKVNSGSLDKLLTCFFCKIKFVNINCLQNHMFRCRKFKNQNYVCENCGENFKTRRTIIRHIIQENKQIGFGLIDRHIQIPKSYPFKKTKSAFKGVLQMFELYPGNVFLEIEKLIFHYKKAILDLMYRVIKSLKTFKVQFCIQCSFVRGIADLKIYTVAYFCTKQIIINENFNENKFLSSITMEFDDAIQNFENTGSGWKLIEIDRLDVQIIMYIPMKAGYACQDALNEFDPNIFKKKALINIKTENDIDDKCFLYCVLCFIANKLNELNPQNPKIHINRISALKKYIQYLKLERIKYPVGLREIKFFEKDNSHLSIKINIYAIARIDSFTQSIIPYYISKLDAMYTINLLKFKNHFYFIKNFDRLCNDRLSFNFKYCPNCINSFKTEIALKNHLEICNKFKPVRLLMPEKNKLKFDSYKKVYKHIFLIFCDFEALLVKKDIDLSKNVRQVEEHIPCSFAMVVIFNNNEVIFKKYYSGKNCVQVFMKTLKRVCARLMGYLSENKPMNQLTESQLEHIKNTNNCELCNEPFNDESDKRLDHDHLTGEFRYVLHNECNLQFRIPQRIPVIFHNLTNYDQHFIIHALQRDSVYKKINVIPESFEKYKCIDLDELRFIDSCQFLKESLDGLTNNLRKSNYEFPVVSNIFADEIDSDDKKQLLLRKGIYMYEYMDSFDRFKETELPSKDKFYSSLRDSHITDEEYEHAKKVWKEFKIKNLKEYTELYCLLDVCLLADIFCQFREKIYNIYKLDVCHYISIPGLSFDAALKYTKCELELVQDPTIYKFLELGIRGGLCGAFHRMSQANNIHSPNYTSDKPTSFIINLDVNNLYGTCLVKKLPLKNFKFLEYEEYKNIDWLNIKTNKNVGYIIECDLEYDESLHDYHNDFPLCPEKGKVDYCELGEFQKSVLEKLKIFNHKRVSTEKLLLTLKNKQNYILHFKNLKLYLKLGLRLIKIHRVLCFEQSSFIKPYIDINTKLRTEAETEFEKDLYKLCNNSFFGKTMQDKRKELNIKFALDAKQCLKFSKNPLFENSRIINEDCVIMKLGKSCILLDKPIYIGFACLELAKNYMYKLYYNIFKKYYGEKIKLLYTDTDSFIFNIETEDVLSDLHNQFGYLMDFSNFPRDHEYFSNENKKKLGYLKLENAEKYITEFIGLKSKLYSMKFNDKSEKKAAKGLKKSVLKKHINHSHYKKVIDENKVFITKQRGFQSKDHKLQTVELKKMIFNSFDDKKYILDDGISTLSYGHYRIKK